MGLLSRVKAGLQSGKDRTAAAMLRRLVQQRFAKYGEVLELSLHSKQKEIHAEIMLAGEKEPLRIVVHRYELRKEGVNYQLIIREASASRAWLNHALNDFLIGQSFAIPPQFRQIATFLL